MADTGATVSKRSQRQAALLAILAEAPATQVKALAARLGVTTETIRRDLGELGARGMVSRTYGGALLRTSAEPGLAQRAREHVAEREAIARRALPILAEGRSFMIGSGATTTLLARRLALELRNVTVIVHSFAVAAALSGNPTLRILVAPGSYHGEEGAMHGAQALRFLQDYTVDWAILGASGLAPQGPSDALIEAGEVYAAMLRQAGRAMVLADRSKFDRIATARYAQWTEIDHLVSDAAPEGALARALSRGGVEVSVA